MRIRIVGRQVDHIRLVLLFCFPIEFLSRRNLLRRSFARRRCWLLEEQQVDDGRSKVRLLDRVEEIGKERSLSGRDSRRRRPLFEVLNASGKSALSKNLVIVISKRRGLTMGSLMSIDLSTPPSRYRGLVGSGLPSETTLLSVNALPCRVTK